MNVIQEHKDSMGGLSGESMHIWCGGLIPDS